MMAPMWFGPARPVGGMGEFRMANGETGAANAATGDLATRLGGTLAGQIVREFFANSAHFPIANILFELLREGTWNYLKEPDFYAILAAAMVQAAFVGARFHRGRPMPFLGNLVGPGFYTIVEVGFDGMVFFDGMHHIAYWAFALTVGALQFARTRFRGHGGDSLLVAENVARALILVVMYWIFESLDNPAYATFSGFIGDGSHVFVALVVPLLGLMIGLANIVDARRMAVLRSTAHRLRDFSEWSMGADLVSRAVTDPGALTQKRVERTMLFMDIRGFTRWTEPQTPEAVVGMLNTYFEAAERVWTRHRVIVARLIADEVMLVLPDPRDAVRVAAELRAEAGAALRPFGLAAGIGVNTGLLIEGLLGCQSIRSYDVIGDVANTAARLCSAAEGGEVLLPSDAAAALDDIAVFGVEREVLAKGKSQPLRVRPLVGLRADAPAHVSEIG